MSFSNDDFMPCEQVLPNIVLYIDHEIFDDQQLNAVAALWYMHRLPRSNGARERYATVDEKSFMQCPK